MRVTLQTRCVVIFVENRIGDPRSLVYHKYSLEDRMAARKRKAEIAAGETPGPVKASGASHPHTLARRFLNLHTLAPSQPHTLTPSHPHTLTPSHPHTLTLTPWALSSQVIQHTRGQHLGSKNFVLSPPVLDIPSSPLLDYIPMCSSVYGGVESKGLVI